jgi:hypothetical protein
MPTVAEIKQALVREGFVVHRTRPDAVHLAERVRENLIMEAGVAVVAEPFVVRLTFRAEASSFPGASESDLFDRARELARSALGRGYVEVDAKSSRVEDPSDETRTLTMRHEVTVERTLTDLDNAIDEARFGLGIAKSHDRE